MEANELLEEIDKGNPIADKLVGVGVDVLTKVIEGLIKNGGNKKRRIEALEAQMEIVNERLSRLEIQD